MCDAVRMVEGPGCKINGEKLKKRVVGQTVVGVAGAVVKKVSLGLEQ